MLEMVSTPAVVVRIDPAMYPLRIVTSVGVGNQFTSCTASVGDIAANESLAFQPPIGAGIDAV